MKKILVTTLLLFIFFLNGTILQAQCAMCRSTLESNVSVGQTDVSTWLNFGILYLLAAPYVLFSFIAFFWYRSSKQNKSRNLSPVISKNS